MLLKRINKNPKQNKKKRCVQVRGVELLDSNVENIEHNRIKSAFLGVGFKLQK